MAKQNKEYQIEIRDIGSITPYEKNPRKNDDAVDAVAASLQQFGFRQPIVVDGDGVIVCGHTRYKAAQKLGLAKVPVHVAKDLTPEQIRGCRSGRCRRVYNWHKTKGKLNLQQRSLESLAKLKQQIS